MRQHSCRALSWANHSILSQIFRIIFAYPSNDLKRTKEKYKSLRRRHPVKSIRRKARWWMVKQHLDLVEPRRLADKTKATKDCHLTRPISEQKCYATHQQWIWLALATSLLQHFSWEMRMLSWICKMLQWRMVRQEETKAKTHSVQSKRTRTPHVSTSMHLQWVQRAIKLVIQC